MTVFGGGVSYTLDSEFLRSTASTARISEDALALFKFETVPFVDELSQRQLVLLGSEQGTLVDGAFGGGLALRPRSSYAFSFSLKSLFDLSIGFWLQPAYIEPTINPVSGELQYYRQALLDKSTYYFDTPSGFILTENDSFSFFEESRDNSKNVMKITLRGYDDDFVIFSSEEYTTGEFHYFWFSYNGRGNIVKLFIDGIESVLTMEQGNEVPDSLANYSATPLHINLSATGHNSLLRGNSGLIDELILLSSSNFDEKIIGRHINLGSEFVINSALATRDDTHIGFGFDDPTALTLNAVYSNGKNLYLGRSDGKLFRGDRLIWQSRRDFSIKEELDYVRKNVLGEGSIVEVTDGALKIKKASVRI